MTDTSQSPDNVLTREEIDALREGMPSGGAEHIDLGRSDRKVRSQLPVLQRALESLRGALEGNFSRRLRGACICEAQEPQIVGPAGGKEALAASALVYRLLGKRDMPQGFLAFDSVICFRAVEAAFGGFVTTSAVPSSRALTPVERTTLHPMASEALDALNACFDVEHIGMRLERCDVAPDDDAFRNACVVWTSVLVLDEPIGSVTFVFDATFVDQSARVEPQISAAERDAISAALRSAPVELTAVLGDTQLTVAELLALRPGDVVRLQQGQSDSVKVSLEGSTKFEGRPLQKNGVFGLEIERTTG